MIGIYGRPFQNLQNTITPVDESYAGQFYGDEEFAQDLCEQLGAIPKDLPSYIHIDWESTASELMYDYSESNGYYFRNI